MSARCTTCGAGMDARWEPLNSGLVNCLIKAIKAVHVKNENKFHWHRDLNLTNNESHNFQKLRFHALIAHADKNNPKSGYWLITARGGQFLRGEISVPKKVKIFRNEVLDHSKELVYIRQLKGLSEFDSKFAYETPVPLPIKAVQEKLFALR